MTTRWYTDDHLIMWYILQDKNTQYTQVERYHITTNFGDKLNLANWRQLPNLKNHILFSCLVSKLLVAVAEVGFDKSRVSQWILLKYILHAAPCMQVSVAHNRSCLLKDYTTIEKWAWFHINLQTAMIHACFCIDTCVNGQGSTYSMPTETHDPDK